jgi:hypothetical protein
VPPYLTLCARNEHPEQAQPPPDTEIDSLRRQLADHLSTCLPCYAEYRGGRLSPCDRAFLLATEITDATEMGAHKTAAH